MKKINRIISWMHGSSTVKVKEKCRLGGGTICNQGEIKNLDIKRMNEDIDATEAETLAGSIISVIEGRRNVGFITKVDPDILQGLSNNDINVIPVQRLDTSGKNYIIYRDAGKSDAIKLRDIVSGLGGYADDKTPEQAREIGKLLGYTDRTINEYIKKKYNVLKGLKLDPRQPEDFNYLDETIKGGEYIMYHGSNHIINKFTDEFVGQKKAVDHDGPGIYFANTDWDANQFGKYVYKVKLTPRKLTDAGNKRTVPIKNIIKLIKSAPYWESIVQNWDENTNKGLALAIKDLISYAENEKDLYQQIWVDYYFQYPILFIREMVKLGFDGQLIKEEGRTHIIVYNPEIIQILESNINDNLDENIPNSDNGNLAEDIYSRRFNIPNSDMEFNRKYDKMTYAKQEEPFTYLESHNKIISIYKNPKSLAYFDNEVRAVGDINGDIYVAQDNGGFFHADLGKAVYGFNLSVLYHNPEKYVLLHRLGKSNSFGLSDYSDNYFTGKLKVYDDELRAKFSNAEQNKINVQNILSKIEAKNPQFKFKTAYFQEVNEEIENEGVGERYAEREWKIPDPAAEFEREYQKKLELEGDKPAAYIKAYKRETRSYYDVPIFKNPKTLRNFDTDVRAIGDQYGNLYIALTNGHFIHDHMAVALKLTTSPEQIYYDLYKYTLLIRNGNQNSFGFNDSQINVLENDPVYDYKIMANLRKIKARNPQYEFYPEYYQDISKRSIPIKA